MTKSKGEAGIVSQKIPKVWRKYLEGQGMHVKFSWIIWSNEIKLGKNTLVVAEISDSSGQSSKKIGDFVGEIAWREVPPRL